MEQDKRGLVASQTFVETIGDFGIQLEFYDSVGYDEYTASYGSVTDSDNMRSIDATKIRSLLRDGRSIPDWMMRKVVQESLQSEFANKQSLFVR